MRRAFLLAIAALVSAALAGCFPGLPARRDWTFLVYMAADNNLNYYARLDLAEMAAAGSSPEVNVLVQLDPATPGVSSARMLVKRGETADFTDLGETNTGREEELRNFLVWAARNFPARRYALVLWDHGSGVWDPEGARTSPNPASGEAAFLRAVAYDDAAGYDALTTEEYTRAIRDAERAAGFHLDVLCFDACLMQMAEVAGQLAAGGGEETLVDYVVGSEANIPGTGYDYRPVLDWLAKNPGADGGAFARTVVDCYADAYAGSLNPVTLSAVDLRGEGWSALVQAVAAFAAVLQDPAVLDAAKSCAGSAAYFSQDYSENRDLGDFARRFAEAVPDQGDAARRVYEIITGSDPIVAVRSTGAFAGGNATGLAILLPTSGTEWGYYPRYPSLLFPSATGWAAVAALLAGD